MSSCCPPEQLLRYLADELPSEEERSLEAHLERCDRCLAALEQLGKQDCLCPEPPAPDGPGESGRDPDRGFLDRLEQALPSPARRAPRETEKPSFPRITGYEILGFLGGGSMGVVFRARHLALKRDVAIKLMPPGASDRAAAEAVARFRIEAEAVARLQHPGIVQIYEIGEHQGRPFLALEYCPGGSLAARLGGNPLPPVVAARACAQLARAVQDAHKRGIVHRDLKPGNVLLVEGNDTPLDECLLKVTDFGLAKLLDGSSDRTRPGAILGTPSYMAPEQVDGENRCIGPLADVYALGGILYEMLTGRPPFKAATDYDTLYQVVHADPVSPRQLQPNLPRELETICLKCLAKEPERRYVSAQELTEDLGRFLRGEPIKARPARVVERWWRWWRRNPLAASLLAALILVGMVGFGVVTSLWLIAEQRRGQVQAHLEVAQSERRRAEDNYARIKQILSKFFRLASAVPKDMKVGVELLRGVEAEHESVLASRPEDRNVRDTLGQVRVYLADLHGGRGSRDESHAAYQRALVVWQQLVSEDPRNLDYRRWMAWTHHRLGLSSGHKREYSAALKSYQEAAAAFQSLMEEQPTLDYQTGLAESRWGIAQLLAGLGPPEEAARALEDSRSHWRQLVTEHPTDRNFRHRLATACYFLGEHHERHGSTGAALCYWQLTYEHCKILSEEQPGDAWAQHSVALCCLRLMRGKAADPSYDEAVRWFEQAGKGFAAHLQQDRSGAGPPAAVAANYRWLVECHQKAGQTARVRQTYQEALGFWQQLVRDYPRSVDYRSQLAETQEALGAWYRQVRCLPQALGSFQEAASLRKILAKEQPTPAHRSAVAENQRQMLSLLGEMGQPGEALRLLEDNWGLWDQLVREDLSSGTFRQRLAETCWSLGEYHSQHHHPDEARRYWQQAHEHCQKLAEDQPGDASAQLSVGLCCHRLMRSESADPYYLEAVQMFGQAGKSLAAKLKQDPSSAAVCQSLELIYRSLIECHQKAGRPLRAAEAGETWVQIHAAQVSRHPGDLAHISALLKALCALRDKYQVAQQPERAVATGRRAAVVLARSIEDTSGDANASQALAPWVAHLRDSLLQAKAPDALVPVYQSQLRVQEKLVSQQPADPEPTWGLLEVYCALSDLQLDARQPEAALATARRAAGVVTRMDSSPSRDYRYKQACYFYHVAHRIRRAGAPAEALRLAQESSRLLQKLVHEVPEQHPYALGLFDSWEQIGKAWADLDRPEEATRAWIRGIEVLRGAVEQAPAVTAYRQRLGGRYVRLGRHLSDQGNLAEAESWFLEQAKLWPADAEKLTEVSRELERLAVAVGKGRKELSAEETAERRRYQEQSARVGRAADDARQQGKGAGESAKDDTNR
jgi:tetratricopeptide (TPR) repeat protein